jgi:hypothetical protein
MWPHHQHACAPYLSLRCAHHHHQESLTATFQPIGTPLDQPSSTSTLGLGKTLTLADWSSQRWRLSSVYFFTTSSLLKKAAMYCVDWPVALAACHLALGGACSAKK